MSFTLKDIFAGLAVAGSLVGVYIALANKDADLSADNRIQDAKIAALERVLETQGEVGRATFKEVTLLRAEFNAQQGQRR